MTVEKDKEIKFLKEEHECNLLIQQAQRREIEELKDLIQVSEDKYREVLTESALKSNSITEWKAHCKKLGWTIED